MFSVECSVSDWLYFNIGMILSTFSISLFLTFFFLRKNAKISEMESAHKY